RLKEKAFYDLTKYLLEEELVKKNSKQESLLIEYVSANPTGDLHLGHGRGAVVGSSLASIIKETGRNVLTEFYINDAGEQMQKLGRSAWNLYKKDDSNKQMPVPEGENDYPAELIEPHLPTNKTVLDFEELKEIVKENILQNQKKVLSDIQVEFDSWVSEKEEIHKTGKLNETIAKLKEANLTYEQEGALWFKSSELGDERDRVLIKSGQQKPTYLVGDIAYHLDKLQKADRLLDIFGADHHGQEVSLNVALQALKKDPQRLDILFIQFVSLIENGSEVKMSKRKGSVITVEEVVEQVGSDAFRFLLLMSNTNNRIAFDIDLAKKADDQNPVFYVQYAHARAASILRNAVSENFDGAAAFCKQEEIDKTLTNKGFTETLLNKQLSQEALDATKSLFIKLSFFNSEVWRCAESLNPSSLAHYLIDLATLFHTF
ncbi:MAG TPA: arginine--tRNA ligase, partial [Vampirovibrionales bacterium]